MYKQTEKKDSRFAASVVPETEEGREGLKFGPADPIRMKSAMACGSQAKLRTRQLCLWQNVRCYGTYRS